MRATSWRRPSKPEAGLVALSVTTRGRVCLEIGRSGEYGSVDLDLGWFAGIGGADIDVPAGFTHEALEAQRVN